MGKTVLLNEIERLAEKSGYWTLIVEAHEDKSLAALLVPPLRKLLFELDRWLESRAQVREALASILKPN